jgi:hypothetical protein
MGGRTPETCLALNKRQDNKLKNCCIWLVIYLKLIWCSWDRASWYISIAKPTSCTIFRVYWISLYMFRTVFPSIIRSPSLYIQHQVYVIQVSWLLASVLSSKQSTNLYDIHLMLCVQTWTPDDGRKDRPKHVEWYSMNWKNCVCGWFYYRNRSRCTVTWTSNWH